MKKILPITIASALLVFAPAIQASTDQEYYDRFDETYPEPDARPGWEDFASTSYFDSHYMDGYLDEYLVDLSNEDATIAWGTSYLMMAYNLMFLATGKERYAAAMARTTRAVINARDDKMGYELFWGPVAPVWSSSRYDDRGRAAYLVHTGIINYPMLRFAVILKDDPELADRLGVDPDELVAECRKSIEFHERQWVQGPGEYEGYYIAYNQEQSIEGEPLSANRPSALGRAFFYSYLYDGHRPHLERAVSIANYLKNRIPYDTERDAYFWSYNLFPDETGGHFTTAELEARIGGGEDISHGALTMAFFTDLAEHGIVFNSNDMSRFCRTVTKGFARGNNDRFFIHLGGDPTSGIRPANLRYTGRWLRLAPYDPEVYGRVEGFILRNVPEPYPLDVAALIYYQGYRPD